MLDGHAAHAVIVNVERSRGLVVEPAGTAYPDVHPSSLVETGELRAAPRVRSGAVPQSCSRFPTATLRKWAPGRRRRAERIVDGLYSWNPQVLNPDSSAGSSRRQTALAAVLSRLLTA